MVTVWCSTSSQTSFFNCDLGIKGNLFMIFITYGTSFVSHDTLQQETLFQRPCQVHCQYQMPITKGMKLIYFILFHLYVNNFSQHNWGTD